MDKDFLEQQKQKLLQIRDKLEQSIHLLQHRETGEKGSGNLPALPAFDGSLEEEADQVEEYDALLSIDYIYKRELNKVKTALEKIEQGTYGTCVKCQKPITKQRLKIYPQAKYCQTCFQ